MTPWRCPLCSSSGTTGIDPTSTALVRYAAEGGARSFRCSQGHCFDVAREGYVNLLPVQQKKSLSPGDTLESLQARRRFLSAGFYQHLRDALAARISAGQTVIDLGCGEGYYSAAMAQAGAEVIALDIAKPAIRLAAKSYPALRCAVASVAAVPLPDGCADVISSIFAPVPLAEMRRLLKPGGRALVVTPAPAHLFAYREALFEQVRDHEPSKFAEAATGQFDVLEQCENRQPICLSQTAIADLLLMTPYAYKASPERRAAVAAMATLHTEAAFSVLVLAKPLSDTTPTP